MRFPTLNPEASYKIRMHPESGLDAMSAYVQPIKGGSVVFRNAF